MEDVTRILKAVEAGQTEAAEELLPLAYKELKRIAANKMASEREGHTLQPTALVHEAYLRLVQLDSITWEGRAHFFGAAAQAMRRILISYARMKKAEKRGSGADHLSLDDVVVAARDRPAELLALDEALDRLAELDERQARVVECRFFGGMSVEETGVALGISPATVKRDWTLARAWLNRELGG